jgi:hypothetical protein
MTVVVIIIIIIIPHELGLDAEYAHCYKHALRICNTYYFSNATKVARTRLYVTLHVYCMFYILRKRRLTISGNFR